VLIPKFQAWVFTNNAQTLVKQIDAEAMSEENLQRWLNDENRKHYTTNQKIVGTLYNVFGIAAFSLVVAIGCTFLCSSTKT
jgi:hypothetical protein